MWPALWWLKPKQLACISLMRLQLRSRVVNVRLRSWSPLKVNHCRASKAIKAINAAQPLSCSCRQSSAGVRWSLFCRAKTAKAIMGWESQCCRTLTQIHQHQRGCRQMAYTRTDAHTQPHMLGNWHTRTYLHTVVHTETPTHGDRWAETDVTALTIETEPHLG